MHKSINRRRVNERKAVAMKKMNSNQNRNIGEKYIGSLFFCLGIFEVGHLLGVFFELSLTLCGYVVLALFVILGVAAIIVLAKSGVNTVCFSKYSREYRKSEYLAGIVFGCVFVTQIVYIWCKPTIQIPGDITLETVNSFLTSDRIYKVSPLTGQEYSGPPLRYEILCLPTLYCILCRWFSVDPEILVCKIIPLFTLGTVYIVYYLLSGVLFEKQNSSVEKRIWFLVIIAVIFFFGDSAVYTEGFGVLHGGYLGVTLRNSVLVPFIIYAVLKKRWIAAFCCLFAEACIVWTFWGFGVCAVIFAGMIVLEWIGGKMIYERIE